jgi:YVTN family beta-propeller protein
VRKQTKIRKFGWLCAIIMIVTVGCGASTEPEAEQPAATNAAADEGNFISREGVNVEFALRPVRSEKTGPARAGDWADITFRVTDASTGEPIKGRYPAAWMDLGKAWEAKGGSPMTCRDRVATYLQGIVGVRPMIDLNSHFLLVMNRDASISVIDPAIGITGITNLFAQINLSRPGADWVLNDDHKRLFVSMPVSGKVALVDTQGFQVTHEIEAGEQPMRVEIQSDQRYLWVGNSTSEAETSGVTVIDTADLVPVKFIATGTGHHEIAFTDDNRHAFITNRDGGTVTVIDVQTLEKIKDIETGSRPMSIAFSTLGQAVYVTDVDTGKITVIDPDKLEIRGNINAEPGIGPMRFTRDGRWGMVINTSANKVFVLDASTNALPHVIEVGDQPYQVNFTTSFAYVRSLGTQDVALIPLSELDNMKTPPVTFIPAGQRPPGAVGDISIADSIIPSIKQAASAYIVNQAEGTVSYYMEGMGAPMGSFRNYGHETRAIEIVDRSMSEVGPGVYRTRVKIPVEGSYDIAFMMDTPQFLHCFSAIVEPDPNKEEATGLEVEYRVANRYVTVGEPRTIQFSLMNASDQTPVSDLNDVSVLYYSANGGGRQTLPARFVADGIYEVTLNFNSPSTYYVFVGAPSRGLDYSDLAFHSLIAIPGE